MTFPKTDTLYSYKGKKYILRAQKLFRQVYVQNDMGENEIGGSHFYTFNWWKFVFFARYIQSIKMSDAY